MSFLNQKFSVSFPFSKTNSLLRVGAILSSNFTFKFLPSPSKPKSMRPFDASNGFDNLKGEFL